ncbi:MAG: hypothetical protein PWQ85_1021 [Geotoga sp.]|nr:hypothetical protein [Geotoga sp.]
MTFSNFESEKTKNFERIKIVMIFLFFGMIIYAIFKNYQLGYLKLLFDSSILVLMFFIMLGNISDGFIFFLNTIILDKMIIIFGRNLLIFSLPTFLLVLFINFLKKRTKISLTFFGWFTLIFYTIAYLYGVILQLSWGTMEKFNTGLIIFLISIFIVISFQDFHYFSKLSKITYFFTLFSFAIFIIKIAPSSRSILFNEYFSNIFISKGLIRLDPNSAVVSLVVIATLLFFDNDFEYIIVMSIILYLNFSFLKSITGFIATFFGLIFFMMKKGQKKLVVIIMKYSLLLLLLIVFLLGVINLLELKGKEASINLNNFKDWADEITSFRWSIWTNYIKMIFKNPMGAGIYRGAYMFEKFTKLYFVAHNTYLASLAELGVVFGTVNILLIFSWFLVFKRCYLSNCSSKTVFVNIYYAFLILLISSISLNYFWEQLFNPIYFLLIFFGNKSRCFNKIDKNN